MLLHVKFTEHGFGRNDWFVIAAVLLFVSIALLLPRKLPGSTSCLSVMFAVAISSVLDNCTGYLAFDYYDIMDGPELTVMDYMVYLLYAPFGYLYIYFYEAWRLSGWKTVLYILLCSVGAVGFEWLCDLFDVFRYNDGYRIGYSFVIYLFVQTGAINFYRWIKEK
ncbi:hypothetical protein [Cohnella candidum]|uniref:Uncharacterized protein n=1 Tax=Cohnella candidum TaxID=2674991 RepID=A0A3G3JZ17_9BACL|nr:hypothetical protein [Cohnella candidum]AYQ73490.1 hypothetical protein EAV92_13430 [Cohnella candidum]